MRRYFTRKMHHLRADVLRRRDRRLGHPAPDAGQPGPAVPVELRPAAERVRAPLQDDVRGLRHEPAAVGPVPALLGRPRARQPRGQHLRLSRHGDDADLERRCPTPSRCSCPRSRCPTSSATGSARWPHGARRSTTRCCRSGYVLQATPVSLASAGAAVPARRGLARVPDLRRIWLWPAAAALLDVHLEPARPLVPAVPDRLPCQPRRLGDRHAQPGDLRAGERQLALPAGARRRTSAWSAGTPTGTPRCPSCPASPWRSAS